MFVTKITTERRSKDLQTTDQCQVVQSNIIVIVFHFVERFLMSLYQIRDLRILTLFHFSHLHLVLNTKFFTQLIKLLFVFKFNFFRLRLELLTSIVEFLAELLRKNDTLLWTSCGRRRHGAHTNFKFLMWSWLAISCSRLFAFSSRLSRSNSRSCTAWSSRANLIETIASALASVRFSWCSYCRCFTFCL